jgi:phosphate transport system substrate-binding protein
MLHLAGSGAVTPLASLLATAFSRTAPVIVEPSVGSGGGVRAVGDGAVDIGLVARPLKDAELARGLTLIPIARDAVVMAANPSVRATAIDSRMLIDLFEGQRTTWLDGSPATVLLRDREDTAHGAFELLVPGLKEVRERAYASHRFRVLSHDDAMADALLLTPGTIGVFSLGAIEALHLPLKALAIDGLEPSIAAVENGTWKATRDLGFVVRTDRIARVQQFLSFVASDEAARLMRAVSYVPIARSAP